MSISSSMLIKTSRISLIFGKLGQRNQWYKNSFEKLKIRKKKKFENYKTNLWFICHMCILLLLMLNIISPKHKYIIWTYKALFQLIM